MARWEIFTEASGNVRVQHVVLRPRPQVFVCRLVRADTSGAHRVMRMDGETGEEAPDSEFGPKVSVAEVIEAVLAQAEPADWIIASGEPLLVVTAADEG